MQTMETQMNSETDEDWRQWCRLCAKEDTDRTSVFSIRELEDTTLATAIGKFFWVNMKRHDDLPKCLCHDCHVLIATLISFTDRVNKVQSLYSVLQNIDTNNKNTLRKVRSQYGLVNNDRRFIIKLQNDTLATAIIEDPQDSDSRMYYEVDESELVEDGDRFSDEEYTYIEYCEEDGKKVKRLKRVGNWVIDPEQNATVYSEIINKPEDNSINLVEDEIANNGTDVEDYEIYNELEYKMEEDSNEDKQDLTLKDDPSAIEKLKESAENTAEQDDNESVEDTAEQDNDEDMKSITENESSVHSSSMSKFNLSDESVKFVCKFCQRVYKNPTSYRKHMVVIHKQEPDIPEFKCEKCDKIFPTIRQLNTHIRGHLPLEEKITIPCPHCDKKFASTAVMKQHISYTHVQETPFICDICGKRLKTRPALNEHKFVHTTDCPYECEVCHKRFKNKTRLKVHADIHTQVSYICSVCGMHLNTRRTLKMHMLVHSDEKQYKCDFCKASFKRSKALKNHLILHTGMRPYKCDFCDKTFSNGSNCRSHTKKSHPTDLAEQEARGTQKKIVNVPKIDELRSCPNIYENPRRVNRTNGGLPPQMRALLIAAEERKKRLALEAEEAELTETAETLANISNVARARLNTVQQQYSLPAENILVEDSNDTVVYEIVEY